MEGMIIALALLGACYFFWFPKGEGVTRSAVQEAFVMLWRGFLIIIVLGVIGKIISVLNYIFYGTIN